MVAGAVRAKAPGTIPPVVLTFGAGINSRRRPFDVEIDECTSGENFELDAQQRAMRRRDPFGIVATTPNAASIMGFAQLVNQSGTVTTLVQSGANVYSWDGDTTFTLVGTVSASAKLRGPLHHNFTLDNVVVITDLMKIENVKQWNGTTFTDFTHNLGGTLQAKFATVRNERLYLANVTSGTATPHVLLGSALGDDNTLTVTNRPSSSISFSDPFYIPTPDLKPINGMTQAFGDLLLSTKNGRIHRLAGTSAFDFDLQSFYDGSSASGDEAMAFIGNDVLIGQPGRIEALSGIFSYGDVETNDVTLHVGPDIEDVLDWRIVYDQAKQVVMCFPDTQAACWVLYKALLNPVQALKTVGQNVLSPWSKWTTSHFMSFQPTCVMALKDPQDGTNDTVLMGDTQGNIYEVGADEDQDGGANDVTIIRRSKVFYIPAATMYNMTINVDYRRQFATTLAIRLYFGGIESADSHQINITLSADDNFAVYSGPYYYSGGSYYSATSNVKIRRQRKELTGRGEFLQVELQVTSAGEIDVQQVELLFTAAA